MTKSDLNSILNEYGANLSRFCYSLCKNESDADDLFQETCIKLLKSNFDMRSKDEALSFLYKTCLNAFRSIYRAIKRRGEYEVYGLDKEYLESIPDKTADGDTFDELYRAVNSLPYKYRVVITTVYFKELSGREVSEILGIPEGTVKSRLHKAKQLLKKELQNENNR